MAYDGAGNFQPVPPPDFPAESGTPILAEAYNVVINAILTGLSQVLVRDGQASMSGDLNMGSHKITDAAAGGVPGEVLTYEQLTGLLTDLLSNTDAAKGAGLVGFKSGLAYLQYTLGWALQLQGVTPSMHGAVLDGVADDTVPMQAWAASVFTKLGENGKTARVLGQLTFAANQCKVDGRGMSIVAEAGTYPGTAVCYCAGTLTALPDLAADHAAGALTLSFAAAHGLTVGRVGVIYNPADFSWNLSFAYSRAGEYFKVAHTPDTVSLKADNPLYAAYAAAAVDLYVLAPNEIYVSNLNVTAPGSGNIRPFRFRLATKVRLNGVSASNGNAVCIDYDRCFDVEQIACNTDNHSQVAAATYGVSIGNSQNVRIRGGQLNATRHAVNIGGDNVQGAVANREVLIEGAVLRNDSTLSAVPCCDIHANSEGVIYRGNKIFGGAALGGKDATYEENIFEFCATSVRAMVQGGSEWVGGLAVVRRNTFRASGAYADGLIRLFMDATKTLHQSKLIAEDNIVSLGATDVYVRVDNSTAVKADAVVDGVNFLDSASLANVLRMSGTGTGDYAAVDRVKNAKAGASLYVEALGYAVATVKLMEQEGSVTLVPAAGVNVASASITYPLSFGSRIPTVQLTLQTESGAGPVAVNGKTVVPSVGSVAAATAGAYCRTADATNFGAAVPNVVGNWSARV